MALRQSIIANRENCVTVHIWRADSFWGGLFSHITDRQRYCIGHVALQTYDRPASDDSGEIKPGKFINFLPPSEMTILLGMKMGKTPNQEISQQYRDDPVKFFNLEKPSLSIHLFSLNVDAVETMYDFLHPHEGDFTWSAFSIPFFRRNSMSSTKLSLQLLMSGYGGQPFPVHIRIPVLHEMNLIWDKMREFLAKHGYHLLDTTPRQAGGMLRDITLGQILQKLKELSSEKSEEIYNLFTSVIKTTTAFVAVTSDECEKIVQYIHEQEKEKGIDYSACPKEFVPFDALESHDRANLESVVESCDDKESQDEEPDDSTNSHVVART